MFERTQKIIILILIFTFCSRLATSAWGDALLFISSIFFFVLVVFISAFGRMVVGVVVFAAAIFAGVVAARTDERFLEQGFQFDFTPSGVPVPIPTTGELSVRSETTIYYVTSFAAQCDELPYVNVRFQISRSRATQPCLNSLSWSRAAFTTG